MRKAFKLESIYNFIIKRCEMIKQNLGKLDRIFRFALAVWWLGPFAPRFYSSSVNLLIFIVGWIALIESFIGWCWLHDIFNIKNKNQ